MERLKMRTGNLGDTIFCFLTSSDKIRILAGKYNTLDQPHIFKLMI